MHLASHQMLIVKRMQQHVLSPAWNLCDVIGVLTNGVGFQMGLSVSLVIRHALEHAARDRHFPIEFSQQRLGDGHAAMIPNGSVAPAIDRPHYHGRMAFGDSLNWMACPPVIRKSVRNYVFAALLACAAGLALVVFRDALGVPYEPWGRYGPLFFGLMPILVFWPMFHLGRRRIAGQFKEARGRLCTHCAYNLSPMGASGTCPECGKPFDAADDAETWKNAGFAP